MPDPRGANPERMTEEEKARSARLRDENAKAEADFRSVVHRLAAATRRYQEREGLKQRG